MVWESWFIMVNMGDDWKIMDMFYKLDFKFLYKWIKCIKW